MRKGLSMSEQFAGRRGLHALGTAFAVLLAFVALTARAQASPSDWDGDGTANAADCRPLDPAVHPGAVDRPDLAFEDLNCDGVDGDLTKAVFVSLGGNDGAPGTLTNPKRTINAAVTAAAAATPKKDVYVAGGDYLESVALASGVGIFGGYEPITGKRSAAQVTTIKGAPAALAVGDSGVVLQLLTLQGLQDGAGNAYGLRAVSSGATPSRIALTKVTAKADPAANGSGGPGGFIGGFATEVFEIRESARKAADEHGDD